MLLSVGTPELLRDGVMRSKPHAASSGWWCVEVLGSGVTLCPPPRDLSRSAASLQSLPAAPANRGLVGVKYGFLVSFYFGGRAEVQFGCNWDLSSLRFPSAWGFSDYFFRGHTEDGSSIRGSKGRTVQKRAGGC